MWVCVPMQMLRCGVDGIFACFLDFGKGYGAKTMSTCDLSDMVVGVLFKRNT